MRNFKRLKIIRKYLKSDGKNPNYKKNCTEPFREIVENASDKSSIFSSMSQNLYKL